MSDHDHDHTHDDDPRALRAEALEAILIEKGLVEPASIDSTLDYFENQLGPMHGARVVARAWTDPEFKQRLLADGHEVLCLDNFYTGRRANIRHLLDHRDFELIRHDVI